MVGIDDWAWKRGHRYGTIICDLEKRRIIDILFDREAATVATWLAEHPTGSIIARDRGAGYIQAATEDRPEAIQVADRWHLMGTPVPRSSPPCSGRCERSVQPWVPVSLIRRC